MTTAQVIESVAEGIENRYDAIGFDAPDSLNVERREDGSLELLDSAGNRFLCVITAIP